MVDSFNNKLNKLMNTDNTRDILSEIDDLKMFDKLITESTEPVDLEFSLNLNSLKKDLLESSDIRILKKAAEDLKIELNKYDMPATTIETISKTYGVGTAELLNMFESVHGSISNYHTLITEQAYSNRKKLREHYKQERNKTEFRVLAGINLFASLNELETTVKNKSNLAEKKAMAESISDALDDMKFEIKTANDVDKVVAEISKDYNIPVDKLLSTFERKFGPASEWPERKAEQQRNARKEIDKANAKQEPLASKPKSLSVTRAPSASSLAPRGTVVDSDMLNRMSTDLLAEIGNFFPDGDYSDAVDKIWRRYGIDKERGWDKIWPKLQHKFLQTHGNNEKDMHQYLANLWRELAPENPEVYGTENPYESIKEETIEEKIKKAHHAFPQSAHDWVSIRVEELWPAHIKDKGEAYGRAWNEYKAKH